MIRKCLAALIQCHPLTITLNLISINCTRGELKREILEECIDRHRHNKEDESETRLVHEVSRLCNTRNDYFFMTTSIQD